MTLPTVDVLYGFGAASPTEIVSACGGLAQPRFVLTTTQSPRDEIIRLLRRLAPVVMSDEPPADAVTTFAESMIVPCAMRAAHGGAPYHSPDVALTLTDKYRQRLRLARAGLPGPAFEVVTGPEDLAPALRRVGLPAVVKPTIGTGSRNVFRLNSDGDLCQLLRSIPATNLYPLIAESWVSGSGHPTEDWLADIVSVETFAFRGTFTHLGVTGRLPFRQPLRETGSIVPAFLPRPTQSAVLDTAEKALKALEVQWGTIHTELKLTTAGPVVIEVNGRLGGAIAYLYRLAGVSEPIRQTIKLALGQQTDQPSDPLGVTAVHWHHLDGRPIPTMDTLRALRSLPGVNTVNVPKSSINDPSAGRFVEPITVGIHAATADDARRSYSRAAQMLNAGADGSRVE